MKYVTESELKELVSRSNKPSVTIYMPTHRVSTPPHLQEDMTRYKNLVRTAESQLKEKGYDSDHQKAIVKHLHALIDSQDFWTHQADGLAVLADSDGVATYNIGVNINEYVGVDERYHLAPLMIHMEENQPYLVLALAVHGPKLFVGDASTFKESDIELPTDPESALNIDEMHVNQLQARGARVKQPNTGSAPGIFNGHGGSPQDIESSERLRFFKMIDDVICKNYDTSLPLVLISTDDQIVDYKAGAKYDNIITTDIEGNRTHDSMDELHRLSWEAIQQNVVDVKRSNLLNRFEESIGQNRTAVTDDEISSTAKEGRVDTLLLGMTVTTTDTVKDQSGSVPTIVFPEGYGLLESYARDVYSQGGRVVGMSREHMPDQAAVATILRY